jgi:hypothetical protein
MVVNAQAGPNINYGVTLSSSGVPSDYNEERGPSINDIGEGTMDPRAPFCYRPGNRPGTPVYAWPGCFGGPVVDFMPIAFNTSGIAASSAVQGPVNFTSSANSSSFRTISAFIPSTVPVSSPSSITVLMLDGYQGGVAVGQGSSSPLLGAGCGFGGPIQSYGAAGVSSSPTSTINLWNPLVMGGRCLSFTETGGANSGAATITVKGYDVYGMAMSAILTGPIASSTVTTAKAFKYLQSISFSSAIAGSVAVGVADIYGFPLYCDSFGYTQVVFGPSSSAALNTTSTSHTFGYGSSLYGVVPPTYTGLSLGASIAAQSSLGDVRGTIATAATTGNTAASGSTGVRLIITQSPRVVNLATIGNNSSGVPGPTNTWGLVGLPQV